MCKIVDSQCRKNAKVAVVDEKEEEAEALVVSAVVVKAADSEEEVVAVSVVVGTRTEKRQVSFHLLPFLFLSRSCSAF